MNIGIDLDGVLADFDSAARALHAGKDLASLSDDDFWLPINAEGEAFWTGLAKTPLADEIVKTAVDAVGLDRVFLVSCPSRNPISRSGKHKWVLEHFPELAPRLILIKHKYLLAPNMLLIDDMKPNIDAFRDHGGRALFWPTDENEAVPTPEMALAVLRDLVLTV